MPVTVELLSQLSVAVAMPGLMTAEHVPGSVLLLIFAGQLIAGAVVSFTVNVVVQVLLLPAASVAVTVIVCGPFPTIVPAAGLWVLVIEPEAEQSSDAVALEATSGTAAWQFASADAEVGDGQVTVGGVVSLTVNVVVQVLVLPDPSVAVTVTV